MICARFDANGIRANNALSIPRLTARSGLETTVMEKLNGIRKPMIR